MFNGLQDDASDARWFSVTEVPSMAFDHKLIVRTAFEKLLHQDAALGKGVPCSLPSSNLYNFASSVRRWCKE